MAHGLLFASSGHGHLHWRIQGSGVHASGKDPQFGYCRSSHLRSLIASLTPVCCRCKCRCTCCCCRCCGVYSGVFVSPQQVGTRFVEVHQRKQPLGANHGVCDGSQIPKTLGHPDGSAILYPRNRSHQTAGMSCHCLHASFHTLIFFNLLSCVRFV